MSGLKGKRVLVTGASRGAGYGIAKAFAANHVFAGQRQDVLRRVDGSLRISARRIIFDWNVITGPSLGLLFYFANRIGGEVL